MQGLHHVVHRVSCGLLPGVFEIHVDNSENRDNADVPFKVLVRKAGRDVEEYDGVWPKQRMPGQLINVTRLERLESHPWWTTNGRSQEVRLDQLQVESFESSFLQTQAQQIKVIAPLEYSDSDTLQLLLRHFTKKGGRDIETLNFVIYGLQKMAVPFVGWNLGLLIEVVEMVLDAMPAGYGSCAMHLVCDVSLRRASTKTCRKTFQCLAQDLDGSGINHCSDCWAAQKRSQKDSKLTQEGSTLAAFDNKMLWGLPGSWRPVLLGATNRSPWSSPQGKSPSSATPQKSCWQAISRCEGAYFNVWSWRVQMNLKAIKGLRFSSVFSSFSGSFPALPCSAWLAEPYDYCRVCPAGKEFAASDM
eukprot:s257_g19.t1